jgi:uncharacterized protein HemX
MASAIIPAALAIGTSIYSSKQQEKQAKKQANIAKVSQDKIAREQMQQERVLKDQEDEQKRMRAEQIRALRGRSGSRSLLATSETGLSNVMG